MGTVAVTESFGYNELIISFGLLGFIFDSWFWMQFFQFVFVLVPLIWDGYQSVLQDDMGGYMLLLAWVFGNIVHFIKRRFEAESLRGESFVYWRYREGLHENGKMGLNQREKYKNELNLRERVTLKGATTILKPFLYYAACLLLVTPVFFGTWMIKWIFGTNYNAYWWVSYIVYTILAILCISGYAILNWMVLRVTNSSNIYASIGDDNNNESLLTRTTGAIARRNRKWSVSGIDRRYLIVAIINCVVLFVIYAFYLVYTIEHFGWGHFSDSEYKRCELYCLGTAAFGLTIIFLYFCGHGWSTSHLIGEERDKIAAKIT